MVPWAWRFLASRWNEVRGRVSRGTYLGIGYVFEFYSKLWENNCEVGLVTFNDSTHGFPRNEGFFQDCRLVRKRHCPEIVQRAQKISLLARAQMEVA